MSKSLTIQQLTMKINSNAYDENQLRSMLANLKGGKLSNDSVMKLKLIKNKLAELEGKAVVYKDIPEVDIDFEEYIANKYLQVKASAKQRDIPFSLTLNNVRNLLRRKTCTYTKRKLGESGAYALTFDRKDHTKGYTKDNVVACSYWANQAKNNLFERSDSMFKDHIDDLKVLLKTLTN